VAASQMGPSRLAASFIRRHLMWTSPKSKGNRPQDWGTKLGPPFIGCYGRICIRPCLAKLRQRHSFPRCNLGKSQTSLLCWGIAISSCECSATKHYSALGALCVWGRQGTGLFRPRA